LASGAVPRCSHAATVISLLSAMGYVGHWNAAVAARFGAFEEPPRCHQRGTFVYGERTTPTARGASNGTVHQERIRKGGEHWMLLARLESLLGDDNEDAAKS
jgi:hypothetical protein